MSTNPERPRDSSRQGNSRRGERGAILVLVALGIPVLIAATGVVIDLGQLFVVRAKLQATADATALAAAARLPDQTAVRGEALHYASLNYGAYGSVVVEEEVVLGLWENRAFTAAGSDAYPDGTEPNAVWVTARRNADRENAVRLLFGGFLGQQWGNVGASATAAYEDGPGAACIFALDDRGEPGLEISSGSTVEALCGVKVASTRCKGLSVTSGSTLIADNVDIAANCAEVCGSCTVDPSPNLNSGPVLDPLASIPPPDFSSEPCHHNDRKIDTDGVTVIHPGVYCKGLIVSGSKTTVEMMPGMYIMRGGGFNIESGSTIIGDGVTIYNSCNHPNGCASSQNDAKPVKIASNTTANLAAPSSGTYQGILFFQDRDMNSGHENIIGSNTAASFDGALYFPTQHLSFESGTSASGIFKVAIVAATIEVSSGTKFEGMELPSNAPGALAGDPILRLVQ